MTHTQALMLCFMTLILSSCTLFEKKEVTGLPPDPAIKAQQEARLKEAEEQFDKRNFSKAVQLYEKFRKDFPESIFYQSAQLGLAQSLEAQGQYSPAINLYRETIEATRGNQPWIAAAALYYSSFSYEALGDEARVLASLKDALALKKHLKEEVALAEVPARLAASYYRIGETADAEKYFQMAERGVIQLQAKDEKPDKVWLSHVYYQMGVFSTQQTSFETLRAHLDTLQMMQKFSLRSIEADGKPWADMAFQGLKDNYHDLWSGIQTVPLNKSLDLAAAQREQKEVKIQLVGDLLTMINELKNYKVPESPMTPNVNSLFNYLDEIEKQGQMILTNAGEYTPLTPESQEKQGLRKEGVILKDTEPVKSEDQ